MPTFLKVIFALVAVAIIGVIVLVSSGYKVPSFMSASQPTEMEKGLLLTPSDLTKYFDDFYPDPDKQKFSKVVIFNRKEITSEYKLDVNNQFLDMTCSITIYSNKVTAKVEQNNMWNGMKVGLRIGAGKDVKLVPMDDIAYGDESKFALVETDDGSIGNIFMLREDSKAYFCMLFGFYFEDPETLKEMIEPKINKFLKYDFSKKSSEQESIKEEISDSNEFQEATQ